MLIKYGIGLDYLPDWNVQDALREIYQNFKDFGDYNEKIYSYDNGNKLLTLSSDYIPNNYEFLKVGESDKRQDDSKIGKHGEGLKMAFLIFLRENIDCSLLFYSVERETYMLVNPTIYHDSMIGKCFGLEIKEHSLNPGSAEFEFQISLPEEEFERYTEKQILADEIIFNCYSGQIINKKAGDIYVGGLYVCNLEGFKYAYNFNPEDIKLDRDRKIPRAFDVEYHASKVLENWENFKIQDLSYRDCTFLDRVPDSISDKFKVYKVGKDFLFKDKDGVIAPDRIKNDLMRRSKHQKAVAKIKYTTNRKRNPVNILKEFRDKWKYSLNSEMKADLESIMMKAKKWK